MSWRVEPARGPLAALLLQSHGGADATSVLGKCDVAILLAGRIRRLRALTDGVRITLVDSDVSPAGGLAAYLCAMSEERVRLEVSWRIERDRCTVAISSPALAAVTLPHARVAYGQEVRIPYLHWTGTDDHVRVFRFEAETAWAGRYVVASVALAESGGYTIRHHALWFGPQPGGTAVLDLRVSSRLRDLFPQAYAGRAPGYDVLRERVVLDSCRDVPFWQEEATWRALAQYSLEHVIAVRHAWQQRGYDRGYPEVLPANAEMGGDEGLRALSRTARSLGWLFALHEMYAASVESEHEADLATSLTGKRILFMLDPTTGEQLYEVAVERAAPLAGQWSPRIHERYGTSAAFLDVHPAVAPWRLAHGTGDQLSGGINAAQAPVRALIDMVRQAHEGPVLGEGGMHLHWAGDVDGVEAEVEGGRAAPLIVDFALAHVGPRTVCHGLGYYARWLPCEVNSRLPTDAIDAYRAREVAFGHAAYIASEYLCHHPREAVKEYHIVGTLQRLYVGTLAETIEYELDGKLLPIEEVLQRTGYPPRLRVRYKNGLVVYVNVGHREWRPLPWATLGRDGWVAAAPGHVVAGSAHIAGARRDFLVGPDRALVDARADEDGDGAAICIGVLRTNSCVLLTQRAPHTLVAQLVFPRPRSFAELDLAGAALSLKGVARASAVIELPGDAVDLLQILEWPGA